MLLSIGKYLACSSARRAPRFSRAIIRRQLSTSQASILGPTTATDHRSMSQASILGPSPAMSSTDHPSMSQASILGPAPTTDDTTMSKPLEDRSKQPKVSDHVMEAHGGRGGGGSSRLGFPLTTRRQLKFKQTSGKTLDKDHFVVAGYALSEELNLDTLARDIENHGVYQLVRMPPDITNVIVATAKYIFDGEKRDMFIFRNGIVVFWNMSEEEHILAMDQLRPYQVDPYLRVESLNQKEDLFYCFTDESTRIVSEIIHFRTPQSHTQSQEKHMMEKFAISDALSLSVKLNMLELHFNKVANQMEPWIENMKRGRRLHITQSSVLQKTGEFFTVRHLINVSTDMVETPDAYWERLDLEPLFHSMKGVLSVNARTKILNAKLDLCCELTDLLSHHLHSNHANRLELMIVVLILIEILFECLHYYERYTERHSIEESIGEDIGS